VLRIELCE